MTLIVGALDKLLRTLHKHSICHGNLKLSNIFVHLSSGIGSTPQFNLIISDPHLPYMFDKPIKDSQAIADIIHTLVSGRPPVMM